MYSSYIHNTGNIQEETPPKGGVAKVSFWNIPGMCLLNGMVVTAVSHTWYASKHINNWCMSLSVYCTTPNKAPGTGTYLNAPRKHGLLCYVHTPGMHYRTWHAPAHYILYTIFVTNSTTVLYLLLLVSSC